MVYSQAAYLMETDVRFGDYELGQPFAAAVEFTNHGLTPAYDVRLYAHLTYEETPFRFTHERAKDISDMPYEVHTHVTGPNGINSQMFAHKADALTREMCEFERTNPLHFWGLVTYTDIFGRERWTEFCYRKLIAGQRGKGEEISFSMTNLHNGADRPETN